MPREEKWRLLVGEGCIFARDSPPQAIRCLPSALSTPRLALQELLVLPLLLPLISVALDRLHKLIMLRRDLLLLLRALKLQLRDAFYMLCTLVVAPS